MWVSERFAEVSITVLVAVSCPAGCVARCASLVCTFSPFFAEAGGASKYLVFLSSTTKQQRRISIEIEEFKMTQIIEYLVSLGYLRD